MAKKKAVRKKVSSARAVAKKSAPKPRKKSETAAGPLLPEKLLVDQTVVLAGRFHWSPTRKQLTQFLRQEGARVSTKLTAKTDMLIVGEGATAAAKKQAAKLNQAGAAIQVVDDLGHLVQLPQHPVDDLLRNPADACRLADLMDLVWLGIRDMEVRGAVFENITLGRGNGKVLEFNTLSFDHCTFVDSRFDEVSIGTYLESVVGCTFENCCCNDFTTDGVRDLTVSGMTGTQLDPGAIVDSRMSGLRVDHLGLSSLSKSVLSDCVAEVTGEPLLPEHHHLSIEDSTLSQCELGSASFEVLDVERSELTDVRWCGGTVRGCTFQQCRLSNVVFENLQLQEVKFEGCELKNVKFKGCQGHLLSFGDSQVESVVAEKSTFGLVDASDEQLQNSKGLNQVRRLGTAGSAPSIGRLAGVFVKADRLKLTATCSREDGKSMAVEVRSEWNYVTLEATVSGKDEIPWQISVGHWQKKATRQDVETALQRLAIESRMSDIDASTLKVKTSKCPLKPAELKRLILEALYEAMGKEPQSEEEIAQAKKESRARVTTVKKQMLSELQGADVKAFNKHSTKERRDAGRIRKAALAGLALKGINLSEMDLAEANLAGADLSGANLQKTVLRKADLSQACLDKAKLKEANLRGANLTGARFTGTSIQNAVLIDADLTGALFDSVKFGRRADLCGVDLSGVQLIGTKLDGCAYNEKTRLPKSVTTDEMKKMRWYGEGIPPHERKQNKKVSGPIDFDQFMERLNEITDSSRLKKALKMLKADSFQLFSEVGESSVTGVVKSQSDADLVYSCSLDSDGQFTCCTQNLNSCGGLRGALCKHLLVLIVGLTQGGELDATVVDDWINSSKLHKPQLDRDRMSEVLLKYKGAEAGEIDWRPTETVPEDFFAF